MDTTLLKCAIGDTPRRIDHLDFSVVVKNRGSVPAPWKWEVYRAGRRSPILQSSVYFGTMTEASREGKKALGLFLSQFQS
jgi:hypothetical protein